MENDSETQETSEFNLHNQILRYLKSYNRTYNIVIAGRSNTGKSTFINSLFGVSVVKTYVRDRVDLLVYTSELVEKGCKTRIKVVETVELGNKVNNKNSWVHVLDYVRNMHNDYYESMTNDNEEVTDERIHVCVYFFEPIGSVIKELDFRFLQHLCKYVNILPVIGRADTLSEADLKLCKRQIQAELVRRKIKTIPWLEKEITLPLGVFAIESVNLTKILCSKDALYDCPWGSYCLSEDLKREINKAREVLLGEGAYHLIESTNEVYISYLVEMNLGPNSLESDAKERFKRICEEEERKLNELVKMRGNTRE